MNKVYEDFVTEIVEEIVEEEAYFNDFVVERQEKFNSLVREKRIVTKPDVILRKKNTKEYPLIIDAKYKRQENNTDYYQVIAYALAIPTAKACCLIYPDNEDIKSPVLTLDASTFGNSREEIKLYAIRINLFWDEELEFKDYIKKVKEETKSKLLKCFHS